MLFKIREVYGGGFGRFRGEADVRTLTDSDR